MARSMDIQRMLKVSIGRRTKIESLQVLAVTMRITITCLPALPYMHGTVLHSCRGTAEPFSYRLC
nr:MAG TPA: hypothetical protein [Caudoviricetes sp.]